MSLAVTLHPDAEAELLGAINHYEQERPGLGRTFVAGVEAALGRIAEAPQACTPVTGTRRTVRAAQVQRFPYRVIFVLRSEDAYVVAISHTARRTRYWRDRL